MFLSYNINVEFVFKCKNTKKMSKFNCAIKTLKYKTVRKMIVN